MYDFDDMLLETESSLLDDDGSYVDESYIDPEDEMSIYEAMVDMEIAEACKKEACKKEGCDKGKGSKGKICEKCGKPVEKCECGK